jgi:uncharacterized protein YecE (DUF72 family)
VKVPGLPGDFYVGTSGWNYPDWKNRFYRGLSARHWLSEYAKHFPAVEVNATFYRTPSSKTYENWRNSTPPEFVFSLKGSRWITHLQRLENVGEAVAAEKERGRALGSKLRVLLWQLPSSLRCDAAKLKAFAEILRSWSEVRHVIEFRHSSWFTEEVAGLLRRWGLVNCFSDSGSWPLWEAITSDCVYLRLHGRPKTYASPYSKEALQEWALKIRSWLQRNWEVHVYFDNTAFGAAWENALELAHLVREQKG